jgi:lipoprotein NlpI
MSWRLCTVAGLSVKLKGCSVEEDDSVFQNQRQEVVVNEQTDAITDPVTVVRLSSLARELAHFNRVRVG